MGTGGSFPGGKADHSAPNNADVNKIWIFASTPPYVFMAKCLIGKHKDKFTFFICVWYDN
jgi:hypothetical protein